MLRLLLFVLLIFSVPALAQDAEDAETDDATEVEQETEVDADADADDDDLYAEQEEEDFESSEKASFEQTLVFPTDI